MKEQEINNVIKRLSGIMGPVAFMVAAEAGKDAGVNIINGKVEFIENEEKYKMLVERMRERFGKILGQVLADAMITG